jgi:hypothetical protein
MGGGTTLVEGSRLGMQMTGVDLNPVAWFVVKNELACSDPKQVKAFFDYIEAEVKPQIQPFYTTTCPRGHKGRWVNAKTGKTEAVDPLTLAPEERKQYRWEGPEVIYTFWAKHGPCQAKGCGHRTPIFRSPVIAEKNLTTYYIELTCPACRESFHAELGEPRMAPGAERVVLEGEMPFTEIAQEVAQLLKDYDKGTSDDTLQRMRSLLKRVGDDPGFSCPACGQFAGGRVMRVLEEHARPRTKTSERKKKVFATQRKPVQMFLLIHPDWLKGASGLDRGAELGGWAGADADVTGAWFRKRLSSLSLVEARGKSLPAIVVLQDGSAIETSQGTVPKKAHFTCAACGRQATTLESVQTTQHTAPVMVYALQCYCPDCESEGYNYGGRFFTVPDAADIRRLETSEREWASRRDNDLKDYWPDSELPFSVSAHIEHPLPRHGYTHWWKMFNARQLLVHSQIVKCIAEASCEKWSLDLKEQALGVFQQYLRNQNMFCIWNMQRDTPEPFFSEGNYAPTVLSIETSVFTRLGRGNWESSSEKCLNSLAWVASPWERVVANSESGSAKSSIASIEDPIIPGAETLCQSSTGLAILSDQHFDLVITDPPFNNRIFYAELSDFFYVWLRLCLSRLYAGLPDENLFQTPYTPHSMEAQRNPAEYPDSREAWEKDEFIAAKHIAKIRQLASDQSLQEKDPNPLYVPEPASNASYQILTGCWAEGERVLKSGGILSFTFHHNEDDAWNDVLKSLFEAGFVLVATYPVRSDETKGENAEYGAKKIEYDIIHVCRKRLEKPEPVSWAKMRRWVKGEALRLKALLEHTHGKELPESDMRVILRGKSLEFYSRHYGQVFTGDGQVLPVRDALLGINQLLDDLLEDTTQTGGFRPPVAEPTSRLYLRLFRGHVEMDRDELHKTLRGTGISQGDLEALGWIRVVGRTVHVVPILERLAYFTERGRTRKVIKTDLDQTHFLIGAACFGSGYKIENELNNPNFRIKKSVDEILKWYAETDSSSSTRQAAKTAAQLVEHWRTRKGRPEAEQLTLFEMLEEAE